MSTTIVDPEDFLSFQQDTSIQDETSRNTKQNSSPATRLLESIPPEYGLELTLGEEGDCRIRMVPDQAIPHIHPNGHVSDHVGATKSISGGGSGVQVFAGHHDRLGALIFKHGGTKDTEELFALATIQQELLQRARTLDAQAAANIECRIPQFRCLYVSPYHLRDRVQNVATRSIQGIWQTLLCTITCCNRQRRRNMRDCSSHGFMEHGDMSENKSGRTLTSDETNGSVPHLENGGKVIQLFYMPQVCRERDMKKEDCTQKSPFVTIQNHTHYVNILMDPVSTAGSDLDNDYDSLMFGASATDGYASLKEMIHELSDLQQTKGYKFSLAQNRIGGTSPTTAAKHLSRGELQGELLEKLLTEFIQVVRDLQALTHPSERDVVEQVREELQKFENDVCLHPADISNTMDAFCGFCFKKNFHPNTGRFFRLRRYGESFRQDDLLLSEEEKFPVKLLGRILKERATMNEVFAGAARQPSALENKGLTVDSWRLIVKDAVSLKGPVALQQIWNCGLSDAGLHNLFISKDDSLFLFDLGVPRLVTLPGFLTKYLFSYFHALGMVENTEEGSGWVCRFELLSKDKTRVRATAETKSLLHQAYRAFQTTLNRFVKDLFDGEEEVRSLLLHYVKLQLLSDASFCLDRWKNKGGGRSREHNHNKNIEKWLWRALWDIYVASDLNTVTSMTFLGIIKKKSKSAPRWKRIPHPNRRHIAD